MAGGAGGTGGVCGGMNGGGTAQKAAASSGTEPAAAQLAMPCFQTYDSRVIWPDEIILEICVML